MKLSEILILAKSKIDTEDKWCQKSAAKDSLSRPCVILNNDASRFCSYGALVLVSDGNFSIQFKAQDLIESVAGMRITFLNDIYSHNEVMQLWDKAIAKAKQQESIENV